MKSEKYIIIALITAFCGNILAQNSHSELSVYGGGGLSGLKYKPVDGSQSMRFGGLSGIGYTWFLNEKWGIVTGVEFGFYGAKCTFSDNLGNSYQAESGTSEQAGNDFTFDYSFKGYEEKQKATYIQIPVMAQFQTGIFYAAGGVKLGFPVSSNYKSSAVNLATSGYFPFEDQTYTTLPDRGFGTYTPFSAKDDLDLNMTFALAIEAGAKWVLSEKINLYAGIYFDYGLNNIAESNHFPIVEYSKDVSGKLTYHSATNLADSMKPLAIGLKVRISYSL